MAERVVDSGAFEAAVRHAIVAARVLAHAVLVPLGVVDERTVARRIAFVGQEVAGPLPAENVVRRIAPRRALIGLVAGEKVQEQRGMIERPGEPGRTAAPAEDPSEQLFAGIASE